MRLFMREEFGKKRKTVQKILSTLSPLGSGKKEMREALAVSEQKYKMAFEYTGTGMLIIEQDMTISLLNQRICEMTGYTHTEIEGRKRWTDIVVAEDCQQMMHYHNVRRVSPETVPSEYEFRYRHKNGSIRNSLLTVSMIPGTKKSLISMLDITERKNMEQALRESEEKYRDLFENANDIIYIHDLEGNFLSANAVAFNTYGYTFAEMKKLNIRDIIDPLYYETAFAQIQERIDSKSLGSPYEVLSYKKSGESVWVEVKSRLIQQNGESIGIQGIARDISERKAMEKELRESRQRFKETADLLPSIICELDNNNHFTYVNKIGLQSFGYNRDDLTAGIPLEQVVHNDDIDRLKQNISFHMSGQKVTPQEYRLAHKNGSIRNYFVCAAPIKKDDITVGIRSCVLDITDRKQVEQKLQQSEERLRSIISGSPIGIAVFNKKGTFVDINSSFKRMFNLPEQVEYANISFSLFDHIQEINNFKTELEQGENVEFESSFDFTFVNNQETFEIIPMSKRIFLWNIIILGIKPEHDTMYLVHIQDITARKKSEEEKLNRAQQSLVEANRIAEELRKQMHQERGFNDMISRSPVMQEIFTILPEISQTSTTVLITGESGTGKELVAKSIHKLSPRKTKPFIAINCGALPDNLLESELFGYKAGAFTDAKKDKPGKFVLAHKGTIFLDEIGDISPVMQVKLLRVLQERVVEPLGSTSLVPVDVRVIAATNRDLPEMIRNGAFREDLYYRIKVLTLSLPPLRERKCDIPLLSDHFLGIFNNRYKKKISDISSKTLDILLGHHYPGNIREFENILEHAFIFCKGSKIEPEHLPPEIKGQEHAITDTQSPFAGIQTFEELEKGFIEHVLKETGGSKVKAAKRLGIHKATLFRKIKNLGVEAD